MILRVYWYIISLYVPLQNLNLAVRCPKKSNVRRINITYPFPSCLLCPGDYLCWYKYARMHARTHTGQWALLQSVFVCVCVQMYSSTLTQPFILVCSTSCLRLTVNPMCISVNAGNMYISSTLPALSSPQSLKHIGLRFSVCELLYFSLVCVYVWRGGSETTVLCPASSRIGSGLCWPAACASWPLASAGPPCPATRRPHRSESSSQTCLHLIPGRAVWKKKIRAHSLWSDAIRSQWM